MNLIPVYTSIDTGVGSLNYLLSGKKHRTVARKRMFNFHSIIFYITFYIVCCRLSRFSKLAKIVS